MFTLTKLIPFKQLIALQMPAFALSFIIAEFLYKFKSFALECVAFLVTWYILDAVINFFVQLTRRKTTQQQQ